jgi:hypothetical protein
LENAADSDTLDWRRENNSNSAQQLVRRKRW